MNDVLTALIAGKVGGGGEKLVWTETVPEVNLTRTCSELNNLANNGACLNAEVAKNIYSAIGYENAGFSDGPTGICLVNIDSETDFIPSNTDEYYENNYSSTNATRTKYTLETLYYNDDVVYVYKKVRAPSDYFPAGAVVIPKTFTFEEMSFPKGIYFGYTSRSDYQRATYSIIRPESTNVVRHLDSKYIKDMYFEETVWTPVFDSLGGVFNANALYDAYNKHETGVPFKAVIDGIDYFEFTRENGSGNNVLYTTSDGKYVATANMANLSVTHNAESWDWYTGETVVHPLDSKYLPAPYIVDLSVSSVDGNEILDKLLTGAQVYVYDGTGYSSIVRFGVSELTTGDVTYYTLNIYYGYLASGSLIHVSKSLSIDNPYA